ncbi:AMP-binding protein [Alteraurantiacibacter buctensis]|uniref:AMP-binding protein n=1 Tax=Alteraurantiacibacter buctensis TaxID=1503981 RepID=A0A844YXI6_9SPHN|nr:AMP-binding protein [Alteraurantiacibacter buctensis]MXO71882.1 AMP-binding protein [Alteraurantiacibacter buctensis]
MTALQDLWTTIAEGDKRDFMVLPRQRVSYADLREMTGQWLSWFSAAGIAPGDRLVIRTADEVAAVTAFIAALLDGVVPVLLTADTPDARLAGVVEAVEPAGVAADILPAGVDTRIAVLALSPAPAPARPSWFSRDRRANTLAFLPQSDSRRVPHLPGDDAGLAYLLFTSGTTAAPTGVQITRANLLANLATQTRLFGYDGKARIFNDMILAHADGMIQGPIQALYCGGTVIRAGGFDLARIEQWLNRVRAERASHVITVPTVWAMIDRYAAHDDYFDAPECRLLLSCAAHLPEDLWRRLEARFARPVCNQYGLTETVVTALWAGPHPEMGKVGTLGKVADGEARVADADAAGTGELQLRGDNVFPGYWRDPARTAASFTADGWFKTGDLARRLADGSFAYMGRSKTVIMAGGFLIRPEEIDEAMLRHPAVAESVTIGIEDDLFGEVPVTAVVLAHGAAAADENALAAHARACLEAQKVPKRIVMVPAIARGPSGKPVLADLRRLLTATVVGDPLPANHRDITAEVTALAADVFRVPAEALALTSGRGSVAGWDSFSQLNFVFAVEHHFGLSIPAARVATIETIADMVRTVRDLSA